MDIAIPLCQSYTEYCVCALCSIFIYASELLQLFTFQTNILISNLMGENRNEIESLHIGNKDFTAKLKALK